MDDTHNSHSQAGNGEMLQDLIGGNPEDLGDVDTFNVIDRLVPVAGLKVLDVGCGGGDLTRQLAARGAEAVGIEPDPVQAAKNRDAEPMPGLAFMEAPGQNLPIADGSVDGVIFAYSLHHVPEAQMEAALAEALRVLKPETGFLLAIDPLPGGSLDDLYGVFLDETGLWKRAYDALKRNAAPHFTEACEFRFREEIAYQSYAAFVDEMIGTSYQNFRREQVDTPQVKALFEAGKREDAYVFIQHARVNLFHGPVG